MKKRNFHKWLIAVSVVALTLALAVPCVFAEGEKAVNNAQPSYEIEDTNPAIYVAQKNADSVVGVITNVETWDRSTRETSMETYSEGSGVVIAENGYIVTNYHVVASGDSYQVLLPSGDKVDAELVGYDSSVDLAVLKVDADTAKKLVPAAIGTVEKVYVGSTVVAIGNPGGETLSNTVTSGVISCLARKVDGGNTSRTVQYIQHDAAISSGNSGGGLFDVNGNLIGINTLKMGNSYYSNASYEGLGFAIPVDSAWPIASQIIEFGKAHRLALGVSVQEANGAEEATDEETPAGLYVAALTAGGPAEKAGILEGDYITAIDGERVKQMEDLTDVIDAHEEGDKVTVTVARYVVDDGSAPADDDGFTRTAFRPTAGRNPFSGFGFPFGFPFGDFYDYDDDDSYYPYQYNQPRYRVQILDIEVELAYPD